jgi:GDP-L-fucose synthase
MPKIKVLLTGASGMVGRNILEHPALDSYEVLKPNSAELNLLEFDKVRQYIVAHKPDVVIHAAGKVGGIQANLREPVSFLVDNLDMGRNTVLASHAAGVKRFINLGSSCMYPCDHEDAMTEDMVLTGQLEPTNEGYALAKILTARLCEYLTREDGAYQYKTLIPCNVYGSYDKFDPAHSHLLPAIIHKVHLAKTLEQQSVEIWGDGTARREFMYAGDLADAILRAIDFFDTLPSCMNVGLGCDHTVNDYYRSVAEVIGYTGSFVYDQSKPVGMKRKLVSIQQQQLWGWTASHSLKAGIEKTYAYYLKGLTK